MLPPSLKYLADLLTTLPSIGPRQGLRLAFYIMNLGAAKIAEFSEALLRISTLKLCAQCFFVHGNADGLCDICRNPQRNGQLVAIVEKETDVMSLEKTKKFLGHYLVLGELTKSGVLDYLQKMKLAHLAARVRKFPGGAAEEIILAINPTTYGDLSAMVIAKELTGLAKKITRLGRGIPTGGEIEFADEETLGAALERRL